MLVSRSVSCLFFEDTTVFAVRLLRLELCVGFCVEAWRKVAILVQGDGLGKCPTKTPRGIHGTNKDIYLPTDLEPKWGPGCFD